MGVSYETFMPSYETPILKGGLLNKTLINFLCIVACNVVRGELWLATSALVHAP